VKRETETQSVPEASEPVDSELLERPYMPPPLFIREEVELGGGYHSYRVSWEQERDWSEPYTKSSQVRYRNRVVRVPFPPATVSGIKTGDPIR